MKSSIKKKFKLLSCIICSDPETDICHIRSKGAGGVDEEFNLFPACRSCHGEQHRSGIVTFYMKHREVRECFKEKGWGWGDGWGSGWGEVIS
jgi:5-methylcytosine-specific restriction endonuclease McrA